MEASLGTWLEYYLIGLLGLYLHIMADGKSANPIPWIKEHSQDFVYSLVAYNAILFLWYKEGVSFMGMLQGQPSGMTLAVGYVGNSILKNVVSGFAKKAGVPEEEVKKG